MVLIIGRRAAPCPPVGDSCRPWRPWVALGTRRACGREGHQRHVEVVVVPAHDLAVLGVRFPSRTRYENHHGMLAYRQAYTHGRDLARVLAVHGDICAGG